MKTVVEWYKKAIFEMLKHKENLSDEMFLQNMLNIHIKAKQMEKQQIMDAFHKQSQKFYCEEEAEQYYNETFKSE